MRSFFEWKMRGREKPKIIRFNGIFRIFLHNDNFYEVFSIILVFAATANFQPSLDPVCHKR
jgi:hypothetical protein